MSYLDRVDQIYALGEAGKTGFIGENYYSAYLTWRDRASEIDAGTAIPGGHWDEFLTADRDNGLLHPTRGYQPLYTLFVQGNVTSGTAPGTKPPGVGIIPPGGMGDLLKNPLVLAGGALVLILMLKK